MDTEKTIRDDVTVVEKNSSTKDKTVVETSKSEYNQQRYPFQTFREFKIVKALPATGGEADNYIIEGSGSRYFLKLYRTGIKPKEEILQKTYELSRKAPEHIIKIYEYGYDREWNRWYEVQEYIEFGNLKEFTQKRNLIGNFDFVKEVIKELSEAIHNLHQMGIIHRDLKLSNVLVRKDNPLDIVLIDFGISSLLESDISKVLTTVKGTYAYSAPESFSGYFGKEVDWWAFGMIILELITGENPLSGLSQQVIMNTIITKNVPLDDKIQEDFKVLLKGLLTRDPKKRWGYQQIKSWLEGRRDIPVYYGEDTQEYSLKDWIEAGFTEQGAKIWMQAVDDPKLARIFKDDVGLAPAEAKKWIDVGIKNPDVILKWVNAGFDNPEDIKIYEDLGLGIKQVVDLTKYGYNSDDIRYCMFVLGLNSTSLIHIGKIAKELSLNIRLVISYISVVGYKPEILKDIQFFVKNLVKSDLIKEALDNGLSLKEYMEWVSFGFKNIEEINQWKNFEPSEASKWKKLGFKSHEVAEWNKFPVDEALSWKSLGFTPKQVLLCKSIGLNKVEDVKKWLSFGFKLEEIKSWKYSYVNSPEEAIDWICGGYSYSKVKKLKKENINLKFIRYRKILFFIIVSCCFFYSLLIYMEIWKEYSNEITTIQDEINRLEELVTSDKIDIDFLVEKEKYVYDSEEKETISKLASLKKVSIISNQMKIRDLKQKLEGLKVSHLFWIYFLKFMLMSYFLYSLYLFIADFLRKAKFENQLKRETCQPLEIRMILTGMALLLSILISFDLK